MKKVQRFINQHTGEEFNNETICLKAETKSKGVLNLFKFWKKAKDDKTCDFSNGVYCYQRTKEEFDNLIDGIIEAVKKYEPWVFSQYEDHGGLKKEFVIGHTFLGRYLDDNNSELYEWWCLQGNICPKCYREYGQMYFATHCYCNGTSDSFGKPKAIPTKTL